MFDEVLYDSEDSVLLSVHPDENTLSYTTIYRSCTELILVVHSKRFSYTAFITLTSS